MCQSMTAIVLSINDLDHGLKNHLWSCVLRSVVLLGYLQSWLGSSGAFVLQMLLVFIVRPVLWKAQHLCKVGDGIIIVRNKAMEPWREMVKVLDQGHPGVSRSSG